MLKEGGRSPGGRGGRRAHRVLVAAEIALAVMLLAGAGLLVRGVAKLTGEDPGFRPGNVMTAGIQLTGGAYGSWPQVEQFHSALVQALQQQPGVEAAGASNFLPLAPGWRIPFLRRGMPPPRRGDEPTAQYHSVSDGYFETLGVPLLRGRLFDAHDTAQSRGVVVVNQALARRYFGDADPVGQTVASLTTNIGPLGATLMKDRDHVVIGVVGDVKNSSLQGRDRAGPLSQPQAVSVQAHLPRRARERRGTRGRRHSRRGARRRSRASGARGATACRRWSALRWSGRDC